MSLTTCKIHFTKQPSKSIYASPSLMKQLNLKPNQMIQLKLGKKQVRTGIKRINTKGRHLYIPRSIQGRIMLPRMDKIFIANQNNDRIQLGPLIGLMTTATNRTPSRPFGTKTATVRSYLRAGDGKALYFAFTPTDINWHNETVTAHFLSESGIWKKETVPFPDVVYNRVTNRKMENSQMMMSIKERFVRRNIPIFNWNFYDKWQIYKLLETEKEASKHVPESHINPSPEQFEAMLKDHQFVYLKPTGGSLGKGIYRITHHPAKGYFVRYRMNAKNVLLRYNKFSSMMKMLTRRGIQFKHHVIQQGIRLIELDRCPIDFRFHLNKNKHNEWVVAGIGAKKAGRGSVTTHVRSGGSLMTPEYVLSRVYGEKKGKDMLEKAKNTAIRLAEAIERNDPHLIGELGFDIGIDKYNNVWMFEANAKPGRSIFKHPALKQQGQDSLTHIFEYCLYLSKFARGRRIESA